LKKKSVQLQLFIIVGIISLVSLWRIYEKVVTLGFSIDPRAQTTIWKVEARVAFTGEEKPAEVYLTLPAKSPGMKIVSEEESSAGYGFSIIEDNGVRRARWAKRSAKGIQELFYTIVVYDNKYIKGALAAPPPSVPAKPVWEGAMKMVAEKIIAEARERSTNNIDLAARIIKQFNAPTKSSEVKYVMSGRNFSNRRLSIIRELLAYDGISTRFSYGLELKSGRKLSNVSTLLEVYSNGKWHVLDPQTGESGIPANFLLFKRGGESLLDVVGGKNSEVSFSVIEYMRGAHSMASARADAENRQSFFDFSVYNLPIKEQNVFKWLNILPLAILVIVLLRNVVGITTMGTFTPILISMAFLETTLIPGLIYFVVLISLGLAVRFYLSRLNLLLVPRISAVVILVIILMELVSVISCKLGLTYGMRVTSFPLIIIAWVIERASIQWEEDGARNALKQIGASLFAAVIAYFIIGNEYVKHIMFSFSEINLIILGVVMLLGTYSGYRLSELYRFKPLVDNKKC
jgi:hypothetical protein